MEFRSRRPVVVSQNGCVASSQFLASQAGIDVLRAGGNAADAAVAIAAALNVTEPTSTGLGGDAFCLFYDAKSNQVKGLNGSGRTSSRATISYLASEGFTKVNHFSRYHGHTVTIPGAAAAWIDTVEHFGSGKLKLCQILQPAIDLAETGFPVQEVTANAWKRSEKLLQSSSNRYGSAMLLKGQAPRHGEIMTLPLLANNLKELASGGKEAFYHGRVAQAISRVVQEHGGLLTPEDFASHQTTFDTPISTVYRGYRVWEMPPNGQGLAALLALNILEGFDFKNLKHNSADHLHLIIEALRLSFADTFWYNADPSQVLVPIEELLSKNYAAKRRGIIDTARATCDVKKGSPLSCSDTVYCCTADAQGNACSFINSNYLGFGTGIVPEGCGFTLQNRGYGFSLDPEHPNVWAPNKRPYHTIIPSMITHADTNELLGAFGVMGGFMQPQGHVQVMLNLVDFGMNPQQALDQPRICLGTSTSEEIIQGEVNVEEGVSKLATEELRGMGHNISHILSGYQRDQFGRGQIITRGAWWDRSDDGTICRDSSVYWAGSDPRADGVVAGY